jgi:hypothetical protein
MKSARIVLVLALIALADVPVRAADGWSWRDLNPFTQREEPKTYHKRNSYAPSWAGDGPQYSTRSSENPSLLQRMSTGTRRLMGRTRDAFSFDTDKPKPRGDGQHIGWNSPIAPKREKKKTGWFSWLRRDETRPSESIDDFLEQPRP